MTTGISKEELRKLRDHYFSLGINPVIDINNLIEQCKELNPWLPIDENTPKDKRIFLWFPEANPINKIIGKWDCVNKKFITEHSAFGNPTYYQELPDDPKE